MGLDPNIDYSSTDAVNRLLKNQELFRVEQKRIADIQAFLNQLDSWIKNAIQGEGKIGFILGPPPIPPAGYTPPLIPEPPKPQLPAQVPTMDPNPDQWGRYPSHDTIPAGTVVTWLGTQFRKFERVTPFGTAQWYERV